MFASIDLARRIESAEARLTESLGEAVVSSGYATAFVERIGGGVVAFTGPSSPMNKMIGVGFEGVPDEDQLRRIEAQFRERESPLQVEVSTLADPAFVAHLTTHGYVLQNFENVSGRSISEKDADAATPEEIAIGVGDTSDEEWLDAAITGFQHADDKGVQADAMPPREVFEESMRPFTAVKGFRRYAARVDGQLAAVASLRIDDRVAQLCGAATLPAFRRRGIQGALLRRRLADAFRAGCELAVLTTQPGSTSQANGHRQGFALLYPRAILVKPADDGAV